MNIKRGAVYLVDFGVKYQSDYVNDNLDVAQFKSVLVIPLTTNIKGGRFRQPLHARDNLNKESELIINWMCTADIIRIQSEKILTTLTPQELKTLRENLDFFLGYLD